MGLSSPSAGDLESAPVLRTSAANGCFYEFEWYTAAACVLSRTEGDNCTVFDSQAGVCPSALWGRLSCTCLACFCFVLNIFYECFRDNLC